MQTIITETDLRNAILALESRQAEESFLLKEQFLVTVESIKPVNLIKNIFREAAESPDLQDNIINSTIGLSTGYLSKLLFQSISGSPVKKILGTAIMFGIKNLVAQNPETVKSWGKSVFHLIKNLLGDKETKTDEKDTSEAAAL
ncbi:MAG: hypothetical protein WCI92_05330 [Bacteroidota bacterium]